MCGSPVERMVGHHWLSLCTLCALNCGEARCCVGKGKGSKEYYLEKTLCGLDGYLLRFNRAVTVKVNAYLTPNAEAAILFS